jgi:hypothetical protein
MNQACTTGTSATRDSNPSWRWFERAWAVAVLLLVAATWRLWLPGSDFPSVPMFGSPFIEAPLASSRADFLTFGILVLSLAWIAISRRTRRWVFFLVLVGFCSAFIQNQHRLQPWAYQASLYSMLFASLTPRPALRWMTVLTISIYFYSACGKFDYQFLHTVGQDFVSAALGPSEDEPTRMRLLLAAALPTMELAIAIGLCFATTRRPAGFAAMAMHASLIGLLGPWNFAHSDGVLLWNACLLLQAWFLFVHQPSLEDAIAPRPTGLGWLAKGILLVALLMPLGERAGYWDHWLSWSLYSPHTSRVEIELHETVLDSLPTSARDFVRQDDNSGAWQTLEIDRWSLDALGVPIYPQARFQLGVAGAIARSLNDAEGIRIKVKSVADRRTGARVETWLRGRNEIETAGEDYLFLKR